MTAVHPGKDLCSHGIEGRVVPITGLNNLEKRKLSFPVI